jgi:hypothetical protein
MKEVTLDILPESRRAALVNLARLAVAVPELLTTLAEVVQ